MVWMLAASLAWADDFDLDQRLHEAWTEAAQSVQWRSPTVSEREALREAMRLLFTASDTCSGRTVDRARERLDEAGFVLEEVEEADVLVVREPGEESRGGGMYALRCGEARSWVLQAPHSFHDLRTGEIVRRLFAETDARAAYWNTLHRYRSVPDETSADVVHPADVAHEFGSFFHVATVGAAIGDPTLQVVQIHGFAEGRVPFQAVLSSGNERLLPLGVERRLEALWPSVGVYGADTRLLGATHNVQQQALAHDSPGRFLHIELAPSSRKQLATDPEVRARFVAALDGSWW